MASLLLRPSRVQKKESIDDCKKKRDNSKVFKMKDGGNVRDLKVKWLFDELKPSYFLRKSSVFYGGSGCGKTFMIDDIAYQLRKYFYAAIIVSPTNKDNNAYTGKVPDAWIHEAPTMSLLRGIYKVQSHKTQVYNLANKIENLYSLFCKIASSEEKGKYREIERDYEHDNERARKADKESVKNKYIEIKKAYMKKVIKAKKKIGIELMRKGKLTKDERTSLTYANANIHMLVIFDDAIMELVQAIKEGAKTKDEVVKNFFYKGRHKYMTFFYALQDDTKLGPDIRKSVHISVFVDAPSLRAYFQKDNNGLGPTRKKESMVISRNILEGEDDLRPEEKKHEKIIFIKDLSNPWYYYKAKKRGEYKIGTSSFHALGEAIQKNENDIDEDNVIYKNI